MGRPPVLTREDGYLRPGQEWADRTATISPAQAVGEPPHRQGQCEDGGTAVQDEPTLLGAIGVSAKADCIDRLESERTLREVWHLLPDDDTEWVWTRPSRSLIPRKPTSSCYRILFANREDGAASIAGLDVAMHDSWKDEHGERILEEVETEPVTPPR